MTEAELIELLFAASALLSGYAVDFTSMVFAYVVAGHFVGRKLTRVQFVALTLVYSAFAAGIAMGGLAAIERMIYLRDRYLQEYPVEATAMLGGGGISRSTAVPPFLFFAAWLISVWYVGSSRRAAAEQDTTTDSA